jgi:hypothetical protein
VNISVVKNALGTLDELLSTVKRALQQVESEVFGTWYGNDSDGRYENPRAAMGWYLEELYDILLVVLEAAEMPQARASLITAWTKYKSEPKKLEHTEDDAEYQSSSSPALTFVDRLIKGLRMSVVEEFSSEDAWTLSRLEAMLNDTAALVHRKTPPANERELQEIMHDYLSASFSGFRPNPTIGGTLKNFKPDCGIAGVHTAIEFKIVHCKEDVAKAFSGITEDTAGYKGSKDWTRFYAVIYQAQPFALKRDLYDDIKRIGATEWKTILVNGPAKKRGRRSSSSKRKLTTRNKTGRRKEAT